MSFQPKLTLGCLIAVVFAMSACGSDHTSAAVSSVPATASTATSVLASAGAADSLMGLAAFSADSLTLSRLDGSDRHVVNGGLPGSQVHPDWSPDGNQLVFIQEDSDQAAADGHTSEAIWIMNADGSNPHVVVPADNTCCGQDHPYWSPDGKMIAFTHYAGPTTSQIVLVGVDGTNRRVLTETTAPLFLDQAHWSPDGSTLAVEVDQQTADGSDVAGSAIGIIPLATGQLKVLTAFDQFYSYPDWRGDGNALVFDSNGLSLWENLPIGKATNLFTINVDGTDLTQLTHNPVDGRRATQADWLADGTIAYVEAEATRSNNRYLRFVTANGDALRPPATPIFATHPRIHLDN